MKIKMQKQTPTRKLISFLLILTVSLLTVACGDTAANPAPWPTVPVTTAAATTAASTTIPATTAAKATATANSTVAAIATTKAAVSNPGPAAVPDNGDPVALRFNEFYASQTSPINLVFSDKLKAANGKRIKINGYMAPPLKPDLDFFVLTRIKLAVCPFCSTAADWPEDIMLVTMPDGKTLKQTEEPITLIGTLEIGDAVDPKTGFFSLLRVRADSVEIFKSA